jgi:signal transduction histidine kinase
MSRLQRRLFVPIALILILCVSAIGLFTHWRTQHDFHGFQTSQQAELLTTQARELAALSLLHYLSDGNWTGTQSALNLLHLQVTIVILDNTGHVAAATGGVQIGTTWTPPANAYSARIGRLVAARSPGTLYVIPQSGVSADQTAFLRSVNRELFSTVLLALCAALAVTFAVTRRIVGPITAMTVAAERVRRGEPAGQVDVPGSRDEVARLAETFNAMASGLQEAERRRKEMTADVAHELRTPLTSIRGNLEALQDGLVTPTPNLINSMHEEVIALTDLMTDLQDLALVDGGGFHLHPTLQPLEPLLESAVAAQEGTAKGKGITLPLVLPAASLPELAVDTQRLGQVLRNLLANALLHTPSGGTITLSAMADSTSVTISVKDTGRGIAPEHLPHIFERFYRADPSRDRAGGGSGIGLSVARGIVQAHSGTLTVESIVGLGSIFHVNLPRP